MLGSKAHDKHTSHILKRNETEGQVRSLTSLGQNDPSEEMTFKRPEGAREKMLLSELCRQLPGRQGQVGVVSEAGAGRGPEDHQGVV